MFSIFPRHNITKVQRCYTHVIMVWSDHWSVFITLCYVIKAWIIISCIRRRQWHDRLLYYWTHESHAGNYRSYIWQYVSGNQRRHHTVYTQKGLCVAYMQIKHSEFIYPTVTYPTSSLYGCPCWCKKGIFRRLRDL